MIVFRATLAALFGAFIALALYLAWFFAITHHDHPWEGATLKFKLITGLFALFCGFIGGLIGAFCAPVTPRGVADAVAALIAIAAIFADRHTPGQDHWAQLILLLAVPTAYAAGRLRKPSPRPV